jgi:hypothetical protein
MSPEENPAGEISSLIQFGTLRNRKNIFSLDISNNGMLKRKNYCLFLVSKIKKSRIVGHPVQTTSVVEWYSGTRVTGSTSSHNHGSSSTFTNPNLEV